MKALTLTQPWASLVAIGAKRIETRSWHTYYRGPIAIHAAKTFPKWAREYAHDPPVSVLLGIDYEYPIGFLIATGLLVDCVPTSVLLGTISIQEESFGDYAPSRYGFVLEGIKMLPVPIQAKGQLGIWEWDGARD